MLLSLTRRLGSRGCLGVAMRRARVHSNSARLGHECRCAIGEELSGVNLAFDVGDRAERRRGRRAED